MKIKSIIVTNLGPLKNVELECDSLTVLVGQNGVGKSTLLRAINLFYNTNIAVDERDFYNGEIKNDISITIKFTELSEKEKDLFKPYIKGDELSVEKVISYDGDKLNQKYYGMRFINPEFTEYRTAKGAANLRSEYNKIKDKYGFPNYTNKDNAENAFGSWEIENKEECIEERDDGQFFGFRNVGSYRLEKYTKYIPIPAVHEAAIEGSEGRNSTISTIMDLVVRGSLAADPELIEIQQDADLKYRKFIERAKKEQLSQIGTNLTKSLINYFPDTEVNIDWIDESGVNIQPPSAIVKVSEEGYENTIDKCGHGLQRAFILTMFQELAIIQTSQEIENAQEERDLPGLIIGIEEPELYQHPDRQRHLSNTLMQLTRRGIEGVGAIQVIYSTHSPLMVDYQRFNQIRIFSKSQVEEGKPKQTQITSATLRDAAAFVERAKEEAAGSITDESYRQRLISLMTPWMNEGFFAKLIVLVEGIKDRALILGEASRRGIYFDTLGISVIPCS